MPSHARYVVGVCDNDKTYPERTVKHCNVKGEVIMHKLPTDGDNKKVWIQQVSKGRKDFIVPKDFYVCSNHFLDGKPAKENPFPTLFLTPSTETMETPTKRKRPSPRKQTDSFGSIQEVISSEDEEYPSDIENKNILQENSYVIPMKFCQLTREADFRFFTGLDGTKIFKILFEHVQKKVSLMRYWDGSKKTVATEKKRSSIAKTDSISMSPDFNNVDENWLAVSKPGPERKLSLQQEFLLVLMKLRLGLMVKDLAFRFQVSPGKVSQIFIT